MEEFAESLGLWKQTVIDWVKVYPDFHDAYVRAKQMFRDFIIKNGITSRYDSRFAQFVAINDTDMRSQIDPIGSGPVSIQVINYIDQRQITQQDDPKQLQQVIDVSEKLITNE